MRKHVLILFLPFIFACQLSGLLAPTPNPTSDSTAMPLPENSPVPADATSQTPIIPISEQPLSGNPAPLPAVDHAPFGSATAGTVTLPAVIPLYSPDLSQIQNLGRFNLSEAERARLGKDGFLQRPDRIGSFESIYSEDLPHIVTTDLMLQLTQARQQEVLRNISEQFTPRLTFDMVSGLIDESQKQLAEATAAGDELAIRAARQNLAIFNLAGKLLDDNWPTAPEVKSEVETELVLLQAESTTNAEFESPLLGKVIDYHQIRVERSKSVQVWVWLSKSGMTLNNNQNGQTVAEQRITGKQIELLLEIWSAGTVPAWQTKLTTDNYLNGGHSPTIEDWAALHQTGVTDDDFLLTAQQFSPPQFDIVIQPRPLHAQLFDQLVFNRVGVHATPDQPPETAKQTDSGTIRATPRIIDIAAVFGSQLAFNQLVADGEAGYPGWTEQINALQAQLSQPGLSPATLQRDRLTTLAPLVSPVPSGYPPYMQSAAWPQNQISQWESAFIMLLSNTTFDEIGVTLPADQPIFLEPQPELYSQLAAQTRRLAEGLLAHRLLDQTSADQLLALESDLLRLQLIAQNGLAGQRPAADDSLFLQQIAIRASTVKLNGQLPIHIGDFGTLWGEFSGVSPIIFILPDGDQQIAVQGGRLQISIAKTP